MFDPKTRMLIVDDMMSMRALISKVCKEIGFKDIMEASDGADAWQKISQATIPFGLVISDWNMPNSTGLDLLKRIRSDSKFKSLPFIMVTSESEIDQVTEAAQSGVDGFVVKPFNGDILKKKLEAVYKKRAGV